jgi:hypothetical protein
MRKEFVKMIIKSKIKTYNGWGGHTSLPTLCRTNVSRCNGSYNEKEILENDTKKDKRKTLPLFELGALR